jgi:hypothetical protein
MCQDRIFFTKDILSTDHLKTIDFDCLSEKITFSGIIFFGRKLIKVRVKVSFGFNVSLSTQDFGDGFTKI